MFWGFRNYEPACVVFRSRAFKEDRKIKRENKEKEIPRIVVIKSTDVLFKINDPRLNKQSNKGDLQSNAVYDFKTRTRRAGEGGKDKNKQNSSL